MTGTYSYNPTGVLFLTGVSARLSYREDDKFYYSPIIGVDPSTGTLDLSPFESKTQSRYPAIKGNGSYAYPHADTELEDDPRKVRKILKALLQGGFVQSDYRIFKSPVWRNKTVGEILGSSEVDTVDEVSSKSFGSVKMYHGTSAVRWKVIKIKGLRPGSPTGIDEDAYSNDVIKGYSDRMVYLTTKVSEAEKYAARAASIDRSIAVVLEVEVNDFTKFRLDEDNGGWLSSVMPEMPSDQQDVHFKGNWRGKPNADEIARKFEQKMLSTLRAKGTVAYEGRIPASNLRVFETFKPARMTKKEPSDQEYQDALEKTRGTVKWEPTKVGSLSTQPRMALRSQLIRLAHSKPELRSTLLPVLKEAADVPAFVADLKKAGIRLTPPVAGALAWTSKKKNDTDVTDALEKAGWKMDHANVEHGGFRANYKLSKNGVKIEVATLNSSGLGTRVWESSRQAGAKGKLDSFRRDQEDKAMEMVEDGRSFQQVASYLGGIGRGEMKTNYPTVYQALESKGKL